MLFNLVVNEKLLLRGSTPTLSSPVTPTATSGWTSTVSSSLVIILKKGTKNNMSFTTLAWYSVVVLGALWLP